MKLDTYLRSLTLMTTATINKDSPFSPEALLMHLHDESARWFANAQVLRYHAHMMEVGSEARIRCEENYALFEEYALHASSEVQRLLASLSSSEVQALQDRLAQRDRRPEALPFVVEKAEG